MNNNPNRPNKGHEKPKHAGQQDQHEQLGHPGQSKEGFGQNKSGYHGQGQEKQPQGMPLKSTQR